MEELHRELGGRFRLVEDGEDVFPGIRCYRVGGHSPDLPVVTDLQSLKSKADGKTDVAPLINRAIQDAKSPGAVLIPAGTYLLKSSIVMLGIDDG